jgi:hypothetical protein
MLEHTVEGRMTVPSALQAQASSVGADEDDSDVGGEETASGADSVSRLRH